MQRKTAEMAESAVDLQEIAKEDFHRPLSGKAEIFNE